MREIRTGNPSLAAKILNVTPERERETKSERIYIIYILSGQSKSAMLFCKVRKKTNLKIELLCVQEVVTHLYIITYCVKWVTTFWTYCKSLQIHHRGLTYGNSEA